MSRSRLHRMVVRVDPALHEALTKIAERLFSETRSEYSRSAVTRGLIALSLVAVAGSLYPVATIALARFVHHERLARIQYFGVAGAITGVVLITAGGA